MDVQTFFMVTKVALNAIIASSVGLAGAAGYIVLAQAPPDVVDESTRITLGSAVAIIGAVVACAMWLLDKLRKIEWTLQEILKAQPRLVTKEYLHAWSTELRLENHSVESGQPLKVPKVRMTASVHDE